MMTRQSWLGIVAGAVIALAMPTLTWILGLGLEGGSFTDDQARPFGTLLKSTTLIELVLGPVGVVILGRSAGIHGIARWLVLIVATLPALTIVWLLGFLTMGAALGSGL